MELQITNMFTVCGVFFFQAEDGIRDLVRSRGLGDVYKRQINTTPSNKSDKVRFEIISASTKSTTNKDPKNNTLSLIHI